MAAPNPSMLIFPRIPVLGGYLETRIMRLSSYAIDAWNTPFLPLGISPPPLNPYIWDKKFPGDAIFLDDKTCGDILYMGDEQNPMPIDYSTKDELAGIRVANLQIIWNDQDRFSGKDGNGNVIPLQYLFNEGKTLAQHFFNDLTIGCTYILWTTIYDSYSGGNIIKITFTGDIGKDNMPDKLLLLRNDENPSEQIRIAVITLHCDPCYDRTTKYAMRDLIYNHWQDGNLAMRESDMDHFGNSPLHPHMKAFFAGFKVKTGDPSFQTYFLDSLNIGDPTSIPDTQNIAGAITYAPGTGAQTAITTENYPTAGAFGPVYNMDYAGVVNGQFFGIISEDGRTATRCDANSFRNGFYGLSLRSIINKMAQWCGCDPSLLATIDSGIVGGNAQFNDANSGYDCFATSYMDKNWYSGSEFIAIWNDLFGISPVGIGLGVAGRTTDSYGTSASNTLSGAIRCSVFFGNTSMWSSSVNVNFTEGQEVFIEGADDPNANGIWTIANITANYNNINGIQQTDFDLVSSVYSKPLGMPGGTVNQLFSTPITFGKQDGFDVFIKNFLWQFHLKLKYSITQSGQNIGMPVMNFINRWQKGKPIPLTWHSGEKGINKQPSRITSDCITVSQMGDTGYCICPADGKLPPLEIPPLRWRTHQYGTSKGVFPPNLVFDASNGKNLFSQSDVAYHNTQQISNGVFAGFKIIENTFDLTGNGWIPGSYLYEPYIESSQANPRYPQIWDNNHWYDVNGAFPSGDGSGFNALQALFWRGSLPDGGQASLLPNQFNAMFDIARLAALELVTNKEIYVRDFIGVTFTDNPDDEYEMAWQIGGKLVTFRMTNRSYDQLTGRMVYSEWEASPIDDNGNVNYDDISGAPDVAFFGGVSSGTTSSSTTGGTTGGNTTNNNTLITNFNSTFKPQTRTLNLYSGGVIIKTLTAMTFERYDSVNKRTVVQFGYPIEFDAQSFDTYGINASLLLHYKGTEHGNVEIVGVSAVGAPDYWLSGTGQIKRQVGGSDADDDYVIQNFVWSEDKGDWLFQRLAEVANPHRRIYVAGRFQMGWDDIGLKFNNFLWKSFASPEYTFSSDECSSDSDLGIIGASRAVPTLASVGSTVDVTWGTRLKPMSIMCQAIFEYAHADTDVLLGAGTIDTQIGALPCRNQVSTAGGAASNSVNIGFWINEFANPVGTRHTERAAQADIHAVNGLYPFPLWTVEFWGYCEIVGENATVI